MNLSLVPYNLSDETEAQALYHIIQKYFANSPFPPSVEKIMKGEVRYFKAMGDSKQIGIAGYILKTLSLAETVKTTVFEEYQDQGLGKALSLLIEEECKKMGVKKVMTTIYHFNHAMISIKLRQGYVIEGFHRDHEAPGFHEYSLGKKLA